MTEQLETLAPVRWALVGYGSGGRIFHRPLLASAPGIELVAVVTGSAERRRQVAADAPDVECVDDLADLAARADLGIEAVTVTTPSGTHAEVAHRALAAGLHAVVDKPFGLTAAAAGDIVEHADRAGLVVVPYQNRRWDSDLRTVRRLIDDGELGTVHRFTSRIDRFRPLKSGWHGGTPEQGGGTLLDLGPHLVDQALVLFGPAVSVHAELTTIRPGAGAEDDVELHLRHASGVWSTLAAGMASAAPGPRLQVNGTRGGYVVDGFDGQEDALKRGDSPATLGERWGVEPESAWGRLYTAGGAAAVPSERGAWDRFYPAVAAAIRGRGTTPVDAWDAVATARVLDAARESAASGRVIIVDPR